MKLETLEGMKRTHMCAELTAADAGKTVTLAGYSAAVIWEI